MTCIVFATKFYKRNFFSKLNLTTKFMFILLSISFNKENKLLRQRIDTDTQFRKYRQKLLVVFHRDIDVCQWKASVHLIIVFAWRLDIFLK